MKAKRRGFVEAAGGMTGMAAVLAIIVFWAWSNDVLFDLIGSHFVVLAFAAILAASILSG
ncbi:MAG: hypothetical protein V1787_02375 [Candidatus Micrarchaeota archaeon]